MEHLEQKTDSLARHICVRCGLKFKEEVYCYRCGVLTRETDKPELYSDIVYVVFQIFGKCKPSLE